jgi:hypothetical protein
VLPAAASLKKQGANTGATTAFLISTPESGVDSIALTYALLDPYMTVARPVAGLATASAAGILENLFTSEESEKKVPPDLSCPVDGCCDGIDCPPEVHKAHHTRWEKMWAGLKYAFFDLWADLAGWFLLGLLLAGIITSSIPTELMSRHLGGGLASMLIMLAVGIPFYICAAGSTPIASALLLKGVSPGAALVFLLAGPATNITSLTVLVGVLGKRATAIYLSTIAVASVLLGLLLDQVYVWFGISARAMAGQAAGIIPFWLQTGCAMLLLALSVKPLCETIKRRLVRRRPSADSVLPMAGHGHGACCADST